MEMEDSINSKTCCICDSVIMVNSINIFDDTTSYSNNYYYKIIEEFLDYPIYKVEEDLYFYGCSKCITKINEYDLATVKFKRHQQELADLIQLSQSNFQCFMGEYKMDIITPVDSTQIESDPISANSSTSSELHENKELLQNEINILPENVSITNQAYTDDTFCLELKYGAPYFDNENKSTISNNSSIRSNSTPKETGKNFCTPCNSNFSTIKGYIKHCKSKKHESIVNGKVKFQCIYCMKLVLSKRGLKNHLDQFHIKEEEPHTCNICEEQFPTNYLLNFHRRRYHPDRAIKQCPICLKRLETCYLTVDEHISHIHKGDPVECRECGMKFKLLTSLLRHRKHIHLNPRLYQCEYCGKQFNENNALQQHIMFTHEKIKNFSCDQCDFQTTTKQELEKHNRRHTGEKNFNCHICGKKFGSKSNLRRHIITHLKTNVKECNFKTTKKKRKQIRYGEKKFHCDICKQIFGSKFNLERHIKRIHYRQEEITSFDEFCKGVLFKHS